MNNQEQNNLFKEMASSYVEMEGQKLLQENQRIQEETGPAETSNLDRRVKSLINQLRFRRYSALYGTIAACLLLLLLVPQFMNLVENSGSGLTVQEDGGTMDAPEMLPSTAEEMSEAESDDSGEAGEIIPLDFTLPKNFDLDFVELDNGETVYHLADTQEDDVVLRLKKEALDEGYYELDSYLIGNTQAFGVENPDYNLLAFEHSGVAYVLTCRFEMGTLVELIYAITS